MHVEKLKSVKVFFAVLLCVCLALPTAVQAPQAFADEPPAATPPPPPVYEPTDGLEGRYIIVSALNADVALDIAGSATKNKAAAEVDDRSANSSQRWDLIFDTSTGTYKIKNVKSGKFLTVAASKPKNKTAVRQEKSSKALRQQWTIVKSAQSGYNIVSAANPKYALKVANSKGADHTKVQVYKKSGSSAMQRFVFASVKSGLPSDGYYFVKNANGYRLEVASGSLKSNATVRLGAKVSKKYRKWYLSHNGNYITLLNAPSYQALSVKGNSKAEGAKTVQADYARKSGQKYYLVPSDIDGSYYLKNASGLFLSYAANAGNKSAVTVTKDQTKAGLWSFKRTKYADAKVKPGTYVDIDISAQTVRFVRNGKVLFKTPCVTGSVAGGHSTPRGTFKVKAKARNVVLRGPGYASPVKYWMPFNKGVGLHDANWRRSFGGSIYKSNGSHGCVNLPPSVVPKVWKFVKVGTRVVVHN